MFENKGRQERIEKNSTVTSIIPASTINSNHNSTGIVTQDNQAVPISSELMNLDIKKTLQKAKHFPNNQEKAKTPQEAPKGGYRSDSTFLPSNRIKFTTTSLSGHIQSQPEGSQRCTSAQRVPNYRRPLEKLHELSPDCEKVAGPSQYLKVTEWVAYIDVNEEHDRFQSRMEGKQLSMTQKSVKTNHRVQKKKFQHEKAATSSEQWKGKAPARVT
ncbi:hypothetical protein O181_002638 [Austropuccinia psidii MF-1]|uniref:Uncharacterized protein n=1 Tax=Austropuccinia psidii MF-1 TaxID=1389203 RepID=A0A9Q3GCT8_9BASI|nr:hypothetical protein [Austropuccinia psidii MF-1]